MIEKESGFSRRDFLVRAGQVGCALSVVSPHLSRFLAHGSPLTPTRAAALGTAAPADVAADVFTGLQWRMLGPFRGGRCASACGVPGRPNEFYFGAVNGGVWKTIDGGRVWQPVFDGQPVASIGSIAVAASAPDIIYVGTGESTLRDSMGFGNGVYKSADAGATWTHLGLDDTHHIGKIAVDPRNPDIVFVAAIGKLYAPSAERGVFRSRDGGKSWQKVLFKNGDVGAVEVVIDPADSSVVYAGLWNTRRPPWFVYQPSNGPGGGIFKSTDGGTTWKQLTNGLPPQGIGRTGIAVSPSNPRRVYAVVDCLVADPAAAPTTPEPTPTAGAPAPPTPKLGGFFRSDDAGATWARLSGDEALWGRGWYFEKVTVDPQNADIVYVPNVAVNRSMDGGHTWVAMRGSPGGDDYHQAWVSPNDSDTMIVASDQGAIVTRNARAADARVVSWSSWLNQPTAQIYHVSVDYRSPYWVTGAQQDSGAVAVRSRGKFAEISMRDWEPIGAGGESGYTAGDPLHPGIIFGESGTRYDLATNRDMHGTTAPQSPEPARTDWTQPLVFSKADPRALFYSNQFVFRTTDGAKTWTRISPDLTRSDPGVPPTLDAAAAANLDPDRGRRGVVYTLSPSPLRAALLWAGTDDGIIQMTSDDGASWHDVTPAVLTPWSRVTTVEASHFDETTAYASVSRHQLQDFEPYVYRTRDLGKSWQRITTGLPAGVYVHVVKEDPMRRGLLFAGTERGAFVSLNDGDAWQPLQLNLPVTSVRDFEIYNGDLIVATHGRGFWVLDDISALRQVDDRVLAAHAFLFKPADVVISDQGGDNGTPLQKDEPQAQNPPTGANIDYYLKTAASGPVSLEILDSSGTVVRNFSNQPGGEAAAPRRGGRGRGGGIPNVSPLWRPAPEPFAASAGIHRVVWLPVTTTADGGRGRGRGAAPLTGQFTARLTVNGQAYMQPFTVAAGGA